MNWTELEKLLRNQGFVSETISTDQLLIEQKKCREKHLLSYAGRTNGATALGIGICYRCGTAEIFPEYSQNAGQFLHSIGFQAKRAA